MLLLLWMLVSQLTLCLPHYHGSTLFCLPLHLCHDPLSKVALCRLNNHCHLPGTSQVLELGDLYPKKSYTMGQSRMVDHWDIYALVEPLPRHPPTPLPGIRSIHYLLLYYTAFHRRMWINSSHWNFASLINSFLEK